MAKSKGNLHPKQYEIYRRSQRTGNRLTLSDGTVVALNPKVNSTIVKDAGLAKQIEQEFGHKGGNGEVAVIEVDNNHLHEADNRGHRYTFTVPELPWHKKGRGTKESG